MLKDQINCEHILGHDWLYTTDWGYRAAETLLYLENQPRGQADDEENWGTRCSDVGEVKNKCAMRPMSKQH